MKKRIFTTGFITLSLLGCSNHPTLDDFIFDNEIIEDTKDLLEDDTQKGVEAEKDATGDMVFSKNPPEIAAPTTPKKPALQTKTPAPQVTAQPFTPKAAALTAINDASNPSFDADALGSHLIGQPSGLDTSQNLELTTYATTLQEMRTSYYERNLSKMIAWRNTHIAPLSNAEETLFYPFSGPDVVNLLTLFPDRKTYVMMGLEHVGTIDSVHEWQKPLTADKMSQIRKSVESVFVRSFFRTLDMSTDFSRIGTKGVLPGMLLMLKLLDQKVEAVRWVSLTNDGALKYLTEDESKGNYKNFGVEITIQHPQHSYAQKIYYFKTNLENKGLDTNPALYAFINKSLGTTTTLVKSASFLMHMAEFTHMRESVLNISRLVLQDDSAVPFKFYAPNKWQASLFGQYVGPYGETFKAFNQPKLREAYAQMPLQLLDFNFGYGYAKIPSHLMLFIRK